MRSFKAILTLIFLITLTGCGSVISTSVRRDVDRIITIPLVQKAPQLYTGKNVLWGGVIISSENRETTTVIEVLETRLTTRDEPAGVGGGRGSFGRFLIEAPGFLDTVIYSPEKGLTVAGTVKGILRKRIGDMDYPYPVITPIEIHLLDRPDYRDIPPWGYYPYYDPYYPYYWPYYPRDPFYPYGPHYGPYGPWHSPWPYY
jgi:outer membrane lipoprotein